MHKEHWTWLPIVALLVSVACGQSQDQEAASVVTQSDQEEALSAAEQAYDEASDAYDATEDPEERVAIAKHFLSRYPDSEWTANALDAAMYPLIEDLERPEEAYDLFNQYLQGIGDSEEKLQAQKALAILHSKTGNLAELDALVSTMVEEHEFQFTDYLDLMGTAVEAEAWELASRQADASLTLANPEAFKAQWPDISEEDAESWGRRRQAYVAAYKGWALENLGQHEEAMTAFADNAEKTTFTFLGVDDTPLHLYWGQSLLRQGLPEEAMDKLQLEAMFGSAEAMNTYREAWLAAHGSEEGLEDHLWTLRQEHSQPMPQFALANYDDETIDTTELAGKVILISAWSPT